MVKSHLLGAVGIVAVVGAGTLIAQVAAPRSFDVASIKVNRSVGQPATLNLFQRGGHLSITNHSLFLILANVFQFDLNRARRQILGLPGWADTVGFDIQAEAPGEPTVDEKRAMLLVLLAERFKFTFHHEMRPLPIFSLALVNPGKLGPQLRTHTDDASCGSATSPPGPDLPGSGAPLTPDTAVNAAWAALAARGPCGRVFGGLLLNRRDMVWWGGRRVTMEMLADGMGVTEPMDRPVYGDQTGLSGTFDFMVVWNPQIQAQQLTSNPVDAQGVTLPQALREQLGLKLDAKTAPVDVIVVDHVERPTED